MAQAGAAPKRKPLKLKNAPESKEAKPANTTTSKHRQVSTAGKKGPIKRNLSTWDPDTYLDTSKNFSKAFRTVFTSAIVCELHPRAQLLLFQLTVQHNGHNNGKLLASLRYMRANYGWPNSPVKLRDAIKELMDAGLIYRTRKATRSTAALYALVWLPVEAR